MNGRREFISKMLAGSSGLLLGSHVSGIGNYLNPPWGRSTEGTYALTEELRAEASEAISRFRRGKFLLRFVKRQDGSPHRNTEINVGLHKHDFDWGYSEALTMSDYDPRSVKISGHIGELFNCTTAKCYWDEKWHQPIEHKEGKRITDRFSSEVRWASQNNLHCKGHPLVWTVRKAIPGWMDKYPYEVQLKKLEAHVRDLIRVGWKVNRWDLCNEMLWEPSLRNLPQRNWPHIESVDEILSYLEPAVHWAREENPDPVYSLNDYGLVRSGVPHIITAAAQRKRYLELLEEMDKRNCAPDAIGSQCHVGGWYSAEAFTKHLDELAAAGLPIQLTEFFAKPDKAPEHITAEQAEEAFLANIRMIYTLAYAHPSVSHLTYWGGKFFDEEGVPTRLYQTIHDLIRKEWMTEKTVITNDEGEVSIDAFYGTYHFARFEKDGSGHGSRSELLEPEKKITVQIS